MTQQHHSTAKPTIVLAFSGGLDTSYCLHALKQLGHPVVTVFVSSQGKAHPEVQSIEARAHELGADQHITIDASAEIWTSFVIPLVWSHARMRNEYPMLCSDRYLIVKKCLQVCDKLGTRHFAHGCTGMGNDQLRFDQTVNSLGDYQIHAPIRTLQSQVSQVREHEIDALKAAGHSVAEEHQQYSINENMLGVTLSGQEIDTFEQPGPDTWHWARPRAEWPEDPLSLTIQFEHGIAIGLNGKTMTGPDILSALNETMGAYGVGRHIYTGDVSIGLKGRIVFECPGVDALLVAHQALEDAVNSKFQNQFRNLIADRWADLVYQGFFYDPHKDDLEAYLQSSQQFVNGAVTLTTHGGVVHATDIDSKWILHNESATYAQSCDWTSSEAEGFIKLVGQSSTLASRVRQKGGVQS